MTHGHLQVTGTRQGVTLVMSPLTGRLQALSKKTTRMAVERPPWSYKQTQTLTKCCSIGRHRLVLEKSIHGRRKPASPCTPDKP